MVGANSTTWCDALVAPYASAAQFWARGVEMQVAMARCWIQMAQALNPALPEFDVHALARPHPMPSAPEMPTAATHTGKPEPRSVTAEPSGGSEPKTTRRKPRKAPSTPRQPFTD